MKEKSKLYLPYIKLLFSGLNSNSINVNISNDLYRGALINEKEVDNFINLLKNRKNNNIPFALIYCKSFMSFSLERNVALYFMGGRNPNEKNISALYILESRSIENEKEILLFPFSVYEIYNIVKKNNYYEIYSGCLAGVKNCLKFITGLCCIILFLNLSWFVGADLVG